jgi:hypothetical protein
MIITLIKFNNVYCIQIILAIVVQPKMRKEKVRFTYKDGIHDVE